MKHQNLTRREMLSTLTVGAIALRVAQIKAAAPGFKIGACDWTIDKRRTLPHWKSQRRLGSMG